MMIADLIDQDDYYDYIQGAGVPLVAGCSPLACSQAALAWLPQQSEAVRAEFAQLLSALQPKIPLMLPEVQDALALLLSDGSESAESGH